MTVQPNVPDVRDPLKTALIGAARLMAALSQGMSGMGMRRFNYRAAMEADLSAAAAYLRYWIERESDGKRTGRVADPALYAGVPDDSLMLLVVCNASREEGPVTVLRRGEQLYALVVPSGNKLAIQVSKEAPARPIGA